MVKWHASQGISRADLRLFELPSPSSAKITNVKHLASYDWLEDDKPVIAVPGDPPRWIGMQPREVAIPNDAGRVYIGQNAARNPESPLEPLFRALFISDPSCKVEAFDLISDRSSIRKLLSFVSPRQEFKKKLLSFQINVETIKGTTMFHREETPSSEYLRSNDSYSHDNEFKKAHTLKTNSSSSVHYRILTYRFAKLKLLIRHESDGYVGEETSAKGKKARAKSAGKSDVSASSSDVTTFPTSGMKVVQVGAEVPLASTLMIKTSSQHEPFQFSEFAPHLWLSQTTKLVHAQHTEGVFQPTIVQDISASLQRWENLQSFNLRLLASLLDLIITMVKEKRHSIVRYDAGRDVLFVIPVHPGPAHDLLPKDLYAKWGVSASPEMAQTVQAAQTAQATQAAQARREKGKKRAVRVEEQDDDETDDLSHLLQAFD